MPIAAIPPLSKWKRWVPSQPVLIAWVALLAIFAWTYWDGLVKLVRIWYTTPDYGHGFFVPLFALFLLWLRQGMVEPWPSKGSWWAMAFFAIWAIMRWVIFSLNYERDMDSLFPFLIGVTLCLGGWKALNWAWPSITFLIFMVPLPGNVAVSMGQPLQRIATVTSVFILQTLGIAAIGEGNVIQLSNSQRLEVAQACSGLKMLTVFLAICVGAVFVLRSSWWEKIIIVFSAIPIALISNVLRITLNGVVTELVSADAGHWVHDKAGVVMMPLAMLMIWGEMSLISKLLEEGSTEGPLSLGAPAAAPPLVAGLGAARGAPPKSQKPPRPAPPRQPSPKP